MGTNIYHVSDWTAVEQDVKITWDLEGTALQIKTNSTLGSDDKFWINIYGSKYITSVAVRFFDTSIRFKIGICTGRSYIALPVQTPAEVDKIWEITKTETAIIIICNNVAVVNYLFAESSDDDCVIKMGGDVVEEIEFDSDDTASDYYRAGKTHIYKKYLALVFKKLPAWH